MNMTTTVPTPNPTQPQTLMSYATPHQNNPRKICFSTCKENNRHYVTYAMVTGSNRVRRQLDMPCSAPVFDHTLEQIAKERYHKHSIRTEIGVLQEEGDVNEDEIREALSTPDASGVQFWENNEVLFGSHNGTTLTHGGAQNTQTDQIPFTKHFSQAIANKEVLKETYYFIRDTNVRGKFEHFFAIAYRFQLGTECVFVYASHVETTGKRVQLCRRDEISSMLNEEVRQRPKQWFGVPVDVTFKDLCEVDGWES